MKKEDEAGGLLWGGRFAERMAPEMMSINLSLGSDGRLWREDLQGSRAWARSLFGAGVLSEAEHATIQDGLNSVEACLVDGIPEGSPDEDVHSLIERMLGKEIGEVAGKLHTGRSRNDQVATDLRLWGMKAMIALEDALKETVQSLVALADRSVAIIIPGYTHLQQAQPVRAAHWVMSHVWPLLRDRHRVRRAGEAASVLPLGSGALAGCPFPVDRDALRRELGFATLSQNSMDAVSDRDWSAEMMFAGAMMGVHLSRLGEDLVLFSTREFSFVEIGEGYATGSSLMPQKRNPDVAELVRAKSGRLHGNLAGLLALLKGLPTGYNRDLQEEKTFLFDTMDTLALVLPALSGLIKTMSFREEAVERARSMELLATDLADSLVRAGVPFRASHEIVGRLVREAESRGVPLSDLPEEVFRSASPAFPSGIKKIFDWERSVEARDVPGGTSRRAVLQQIEQAKAQLAGHC
jgi:argininosuccinate lyase